MRSTHRGGSAQGRGVSPGWPPSQGEALQVGGKLWRSRAGRLGVAGRSTMCSAGGSPASSSRSEATTILVFPALVSIETCMSTSASRERQFTYPRSDVISGSRVKRPRTGSHSNQVASLT